MGARYLEFGEGMAAAQYHTIDLARLSLSPGQATRIDLPIDPGDLDFGGSDYRFGDGAVDARVDVSRTAAGHALRLRFDGAVAGACMRCLEPARVEVEVDAREVDQPASRDEELLSPYVSDGVLDVGAWAHDALALALPPQVLCRPECAGLCPVCGVSLNEVDAGAHRHESAPDPRLAKLRELLD
jgi:uncharacterized protein